MIKTRAEQVITVQDWDELVQKTYGRPYSFQQQNGCKDRQRIRISVPIEDPYDNENDTIPEIVNHPEMGVSFKAWLDRDPKQTLNADDCKYDWVVPLWWERNFYPNVDMIINDLHSKGLIDAGEYSIDIDW